MPIGFLGHKIVSWKQQYDELRVNESETYGLNFPWNLHGFGSHGEKGTWQDAFEILPNQKYLRNNLRCFGGHKTVPNSFIFINCTTIYKKKKEYKWLNCNLMETWNTACTAVSRLYR